MYCIILQLYFSYFSLSLCLSLHPPSLYRIPPRSLSLLITLTFQLSSYTHPLSPPLSPSHFLSGLPLSTKVVTIFVPSDSLLQPFVSAHLPDPVLIQLARLSHSLLFSSSFSPRIFSPVWFPNISSDFSIPLMNLIREGVYEKRETVSDKAPDSSLLSSVFVSRWGLLGPVN